MRSRLFVFPVLILCLCWTACSSTPPAPPSDKYFADARTNLETSDFDGAMRNLDRAISAASGKPEAQQAEMIRIALLISMAESDKKVADALETSRYQPIAAPRFGQLSQMRTDHFQLARAHYLNALEAVMKQRAALGDKPIPLNLKFPDFSAAENPVLTKVLKGMAVSREEVVRLDPEFTRNALAMNLAGMVGAEGNVNKGREVFEKGNVEIDPRLYLINVTESFHKLSDLFGPKNLDDTKYLKISLEVVRDNLDAASKMLVAKPDKDLEARIKRCREECTKQLKKLA